MRLLFLFFVSFVLSCATIQEYLPDSYESPDGAYSGSCVKDLDKCTQTCKVDIDGHKSDKTFPLEGCEKPAG
jgi:hypothetical protein